MTSPQLSHLTEEQFTAYLIDPESSSQAATHMTACSACRQEFETFADSLNSFNTVSLAWSQSRQTIGVISRPRRDWLPAMGWALAMCLVFAVGLTVLLKSGSGRSATGSSPMAVTAQDENSATQIAHDNQLMSDVNLELNLPVQSPLVEYGLNTPPRESVGAQTESRVE